MEAFEFLRNRQLLSPDQSLHETAMPNYTWGDLIQLLDDYLKANSSQLEPPVRMQTAEETKKCLKALGSAWSFDLSVITLMLKKSAGLAVLTDELKRFSGDLNGFDGRTLMWQLEDITSVLDGKLTYEQFCERADIHPEQLCWNEYADEDNEEDYFEDYED